jgi:pimeloyl-ACP methyl ester carboxylesterase
MNPISLVTGNGPVEVTLDKYGAGRPYLLLHGGAGPQSVTGFAQALAAGGDARVLVPTHPGFSGTPRPEWLDNMAGLARVYAALLDHLDYRDVTVIGNSVGGWIAAELALLGTERVRRTVLVDAGGIEVPGEPVVDIFALSPDEISKLSYHDPERFRINPAALTDAQRAGMAANMAALRTYGGPTLTDPTLLSRLAGIGVPTLAVWGGSDGVYTPEYGRAYADAIPGARFALISDAGHLPQIETPQALLSLVREFVG